MLILISWRPNNYLISNDILKYFSLVTKHVFQSAFIILIIFSKLLLYFSRENSKILKVLPDL